MPRSCASRAWVNAVVVADVVAVVPPRTGMDGIQPQAGDAQSGKVIEATDQPSQIAAAVTVRVLERGHVDAVNDSFLIPPVDHDLRAFRPTAAARPAAVAAPAPNKAR
jgi:hypothetical protein